jgi:hypothetical protein
MKRLRIGSHRLFQLVWLLSGLALPVGSAAADLAPETRMALFAAG